MEAKKQHYHLVAGLVMFGNPETEQIGSLTLNTVLRSDSQNVPVRQIGRAQQALQMIFRQKTEDETSQIVDVPIMSISYLGFMTEEEFQAPPEGMVKQEMPTTVTDLPMQ